MTERHASADEPLVSRARAGDTVAFMQLVERFDRSARVLAFRLLGRAEAIDDVLQDAYVRAYRGLRRFRGGSSFETWLYRIVYNACLDLLRREGRHRAASLDAAGRDLAGTASDVPEPGRVASQRADLARALDGLPLDQRAAVLLVDVEGFDYAAAAEVIGVAPGTVASRLSRARAALRLALHEGDER